VTAPATKQREGTATADQASGPRPQRRAGQVQRRVERGRAGGRGGVAAGATLELEGLEKRRPGRSPRRGSVALAGAEALADAEAALRAPRRSLSSWRSGAEEEPTRTAARRWPERRRRWTWRRRCGCHAGA